MVTSLAADAPSTKVAAELLNTISSNKHVLVVAGRNEVASVQSVRNISTVHVLHADQLNAYDVLVSDNVVFTSEALAAFVGAKAAQKVEA